MKKSKFTEQQIAFALRQAETKVKEVIRQLGITEQTFYRWKRKYGGLDPSDLRKLRLLEEENKKLKHMVADLSLDKAMLQEVIEKNSEGRSEAPARATSPGQLPHQRTSRLSRSSVGARQPPLPIDSEGSHRSSPTDPGDCRGASSLRLPANPCLASARRVPGEQASCSSAVSRGRAEPATEAAPPTCLSGAASRATGAEAEKRELVHGLCLGQLV